MFSPTSTIALGARERCTVEFCWEKTKPQGYPPKMRISRSRVSFNFAGETHCWPEVSPLESSLRKSYFGRDFRGKTAILFRTDLLDSVGPSIPDTVVGSGR